tara:strand:+ start:5573 stop:6337 length:765 start_codon:yes stop_codon:yes gene_type:complete
MRIGLVAKKLGMTRFFKDDGTNVPVTLLGIEKNYVTRIRDGAVSDSKYIQIAAGKIKIKNVTKPIRNYFSKLKIEPKRKILEFKVKVDETNPKIGDTLNASFFKVGQYVDAIGKSIGKGFAGSMKRHNFGGLRASHGVSISHRSHGSTGQCQDPGRTFKGKKMAGQMGYKKITVHNLEVVDINNEDDLILVKGAVPGSKGTILVLRDAIKPKSLRVKEKKEEIIEESSKTKDKSKQDETTEKKNEGGDKKEVKK